MARPLLQIREIGANVERVAGEKVRQEVLAGSERLTASSRPEEVARWVQGAMERLDALVDPEARNQIMLACGHNCARVNKRPLEQARARRARYASLDEFLAAEQRKSPAGMRLVREGDVVYQFYTPQTFSRPMRCYCSLLRGLPADETVSLTYCQCSRGFMQEYWEGILERPVQVDLVESCMSGAAECKFVIHL
jgi:hypothetical protein